jgi:hypothetical protein
MMMKESYRWLPVQSSSFAIKVIMNCCVGSLSEDFAIVFLSSDAFLSMLISSGVRASYLAEFVNVLILAARSLGSMDLNTLSSIIGMESRQSLTASACSYIKSSCCLLYSVSIAINSFYKSFYSSSNLEEFLKSFSSSLSKI